MNDNKILCKQVLVYQLLTNIEQKLVSDTQDDYEKEQVLDNLISFNYNFKEFDENVDQYYKKDSLNQNSNCYDIILFEKTFNQIFIISHASILLKKITMIVV
jgi:hypothetical protein